MNLMLAVLLAVQGPSCDSTIQLPKGFCATIFADSVVGARHLAVAPNGDLFVAVRNRAQSRGGVVALRDTTRDGVADLRVKFGENGGTGIALAGKYLYFATDSAVLRYELPRGNLLPRMDVDTIVRDLPARPGHSAKTMALGKKDDLFVNIGSATNSCQQKDRQNSSPGIDPCVELQKRAGIWRFDADDKGQTQNDGKRHATGLRNSVAIQFGPDGSLWALQHGRDQLFQNWGGLFTETDGAEKPAEILVRVAANDDYGWPYCFYDRDQRKHVLAPEYGGDGNKTERCANIKQPVAAFPAHWAPESLVFYTGSQFPANYRGGIFIAFHGSWNRAPQPQAGYNVVFVPLSNGNAGDYQIFADGFAGPNPQPATALHRPMGLAVAPDGSLYIGDDVRGRIWRITYRGN